MKSASLTDLSLLALLVLLATALFFQQTFFIGLDTVVDGLYRLFESIFGYLSYIVQWIIRLISHL